MVAESLSSPRSCVNQRTVIIASFVTDNHIQAAAGTAPLVDPARAWGEPVATGRLRQRPEDFRVEERLGFQPDGDGPHCWLKVEKTGCNTADVAEMLAARLGVPLRDVGYSGLKDRHAICTQWFSLPYCPTADWLGFEAEGVRILQAVRHRRKLKRGVHQLNRFDITVAVTEWDPGGLSRRLAQVRDRGVPSYFGEQRFGRRYRENVRRLAAGERLARMQRSMTLSALRADLFNRVLDERVRRGSWRLALPGEYVNLDGTRSGFPAGDGDPAIAGRIEALDLHPTGPLFGAGDNPAAGEAARLETAVLDRHGTLCRVLASRGLRLERRPTRCRVRDLWWALDEGEGVLRIGFALRRGEFATAVLREILDYEDVTRT